MGSYSERKWAEFHMLNPEVWVFFKRFAWEKIKQGHQHYSADAVLHRVRWELGLADGGREYKLNNNWTPYYARMFHAEFPNKSGFFRLRASAADGWSPTR